MSSENKEPNPLGSSSTIPVPMMTSTESLRASGMERNKGIWYLLKHNWRQLTSLAPGELEQQFPAVFLMYSLFLARSPSPSLFLPLYIHNIPYPISCLIEAFTNDMYTFSFHWKSQAWFCCALWAICTYHGQYGSFYCTYLITKILRIPML